MTPKSNIIVNQGEDFSVDVDVIDGNNNPVDLTGCSAISQFRKSSYSSKYYSFSTSIVANTGVVTLSMSANNTLAIDEGRYQYDVVVTDSHNIKTRVLEGVVTIKPSATRW